MSIQAVAWALEQDFSYTTPKGRQTSAHGAKLVLISLCNHADHKSGHCWPSAPTIAREASCSERSVYRLVAALERNGFIDVKRNRGGNDNKQRSNNYWIRFDRPATPWQFFPDDDDGPDDPPDTVSPPDDGENSPPESSENATESPSQSDMGVTRHNMPEPSILEPSAPKAQNGVEKAKPLAAEEDKKAKQVFVIRGTRAWDAWQAKILAEKRAKYGDWWKMSTGTPITRAPVNGEIREGWWFPSLFPPKPEEQSTGPPISPLMTAEDERELKKNWG